MGFLLAGCADGDYVIIDNGNEKIKIKVEIADDAAERAKGLMLRDFLDENSGMLFIFEKEGNYSFWMKNTIIPLDMIWISDSMEIVDISHADPCVEEPCRSYRPQEEARYVLEVNGNFTVEKGIQIGDNIAISGK